MAISKERLKQLIENEATIYNKLIDVPLHKNYYIKNDKLYESAMNIFLGSCDDFFETSEDFEEYQKYGNQTKTEKFPYVSWKDFIHKNEEGYFDKRIVFWGNDHTAHRLWIGYDFTDDIQNMQKPEILVDCKVIGDVTRENYDKARDLCIKLWKNEGEE